jgi:hypothetical protein
MDDEAIIEHLTEMRGIGRWTVEMLLMFRLGRPDVLPADDYGIRKGFAVAFKKRDLPAREDLERRCAVEALPHGRELAVARGERRASRSSTGRLREVESVLIHPPSPYPLPSAEDASSASPLPEERALSRSRGSLRLLASRWPSRRLRVESATYGDHDSIATLIW